MEIKMLSRTPLQYVQGQQKMSNWRHIPNTTSAVSWVPVTLKSTSILTINLNLQAMCAFLFMCKQMYS